MLTWQKLLRGQKMNMVISKIQVMPAVSVVCVYKDK